MFTHNHAINWKKWTLVAGFVLLMLLVSGTVYAQDTTTGAVEPNDLNEVAARLTPLLIGAALIERTIEYLFNWIEQAILDVSHSLNGLLTRMTGLLTVDAREAWQRVNALTNALVKREGLSDDPAAGDELSDYPAEWPLDKLEAQLTQAQKTLLTAQKTIETALKSPDYVAKKKTLASTLSIVFGILLAVAVDLRLFEPIGVSVAKSFQGTFEYVDLLLAGVLMGLGTDWVHQVIGLIIKGKGLLGRAAGGEGSMPDVETIRQYADMVVKAEIDARMKVLQEQAEAKIDEMARGATNNPPG